MITVEKEMRCGHFKLETTTVKIEGEFKINSSNKLESVDSGMAADKTSGEYIGCFNAYKNGENLKLNISDIATGKAGDVATAVNTALNELEAKYNLTVK